MPSRLLFCLVLCSPVGGEGSNLLSPPRAPAPMPPPIVPPAPSLPPFTPLPPLPPGGQMVSSVQELRDLIASEGDGPRSLFPLLSEFELAGVPLQVPTGANVSIYGYGHHTLDAGHLARAFVVRGHLMMRGIRLTGGLAGTDIGRTNAYSGGLVLILPGGSASFENCTFDDAVAPFGRGGAISVWAGTLWMRGCMIRNCRALNPNLETGLNLEDPKGVSGGIDIANHGHAVLIDCTLTDLFAEVGVPSNHIHRDPQSYCNHHLMTPMM